MTEGNPIPPVTPSYETLAFPPPTKEEMNMAMLCHLLGIFSGFIGPLIIWMMKKDTSPYVDDQGKQALNFHITLAIAFVISLVLTIVCIGYFLLLALFVVDIVFSIIACTQATKGVRYRYPLAIPFLK
jgi:uncharacterized protein